MPVTWAGKSITIKVRLSTRGVWIFNPFQFHVMRFSLSCNPLLALQLFNLKIVIHPNCSFSKLFHPCSHVIRNWWGSLGWTALPTSRNISGPLGLTGGRVWRARCFFTQACGVVTRVAIATGKATTTLEHLCLKKQQDKMILESLGWRHNYKRRFKWKMNYLKTWRWHFSEVGVNIWNMLLTRWSSNMNLKSCMQWGMLSWYMEVIACKKDTMCKKSPRAMARGKVEQV